MARIRQFQDKNVYVAAKERLHHIYDIFDTVSVQFSGGKDSLVVLNLCHEVIQERGGAGKVEAVFRDEELIPDSVVNFVDEYRHKDWLNLRWLTVPLESHLFLMGEVRPYVQWDPNREWARPKPAWGINLEPGDKRVFSEYNSIDNYTASFYRGKVALLTGIRADESLIRYRASVCKLNENYINASDSPKASLCKPIYDWRENDVFKYFYEKEIRYCIWYDQQMYAGHSLRVTTPFCSEPAKKLAQAMPVDPEFYDRVLRVFPEMRNMARYWKEYDRDAVLEKYGNNGYAGIYQFIEKEIKDPVQRKKAREHVAIEQKAAKTGGAHKIKDILKHVVNGQYRRTMFADFATKEAS